MQAEKDWWNFAADTEAGLYISEASSLTRVLGNLSCTTRPAQQRQALTPAAPDADNCTGLNYTDGAELYMQIGVGGRYLKARYVAYTDGTFQTPYERPAEEVHLQILGQATARPRPPAGSLPSALADKASPCRPLPARGGGRRAGGRVQQRAGLGDDPHADWRGAGHQ